MMEALGQVSSFRNNSANNLYGQFDMVKSSEHGSSNPLNHVFTDNGEFEVFHWVIQDVVIDQAKADKFLIPLELCIAQDGWY